MIVHSAPTRQAKHVFARWIIPVVVIAVFHWLIIQWIMNGLARPGSIPAEQIITATLIPELATAPPAVALSSPAKKTAPAQPKRQRKSPVPVTPRVPAAPAEPDPIASVVPDTPATDVASTEMAQTIAVPQDGTSEVASNGTAEASVAEEPANITHYDVMLPPSVELRYDVRKITRESKPVHGHGSIRWESDGLTYRIQGEAGILFISALTFTSEGHIEPSGVAPVLYSEKRFRRPATNTHFQREQGTVSFSASTHSYPRRGGEQDRASIVWQLAGIGRAGTHPFAPGTDIEIFVAGARDGEVWRIQVVGQEELEIDGRKIMTWHLMRLPRTNSYDQKLDIWLAPDQEWYPVKLRYTDRHDDYLEMIVSNMDALLASAGTKEKRTQ